MLCCLRGALLATGCMALSLPGPDKPGPAAAPSLDAECDAAATSLLQLRDKGQSAAAAAIIGSASEQPLVPFSPSASGSFCWVGDILPYWKTIGTEFEHVAMACGRGTESDVCGELKAAAESTCGMRMKRTTCGATEAGTYVGAVMLADPADPEPIVTKEEDCTYQSAGEKSLDQIKDLGTACELSASQSGCEEECSKAPGCGGYAYLEEASHCVLSVSGACPPRGKNLALLATNPGFYGGGFGGYGSYDGGFGSSGGGFGSYGGGLGSTYGGSGGGFGGGCHRRRDISPPQPKNIAGEECTENDDCASPAICLGGRCCGDSHTAKHCAACDDSGACERCEEGFVLEGRSCEDTEVDRIDSTGCFSATKPRETSAEDPCVDAGHYDITDAALCVDAIVEVNKRIGKQSPSTLNVDGMRNAIVDWGFRPYGCLTKQIGDMQVFKLNQNVDGFLDYDGPEPESYLTYCCIPSKGCPCGAEEEKEKEEKEEKKEKEEKEEKDEVGGGVMYKTFSRAGSNCGAIHSSAKRFLFYGNSMLCDDLKVDDLKNRKKKKRIKENPLEDSEGAQGS